MYVDPKIRRKGNGRNHNVLAQLRHRAARDLEVWAAPYQGLSLANEYEHQVVGFCLEMAGPVCRVSVVPVRSGSLHREYR